MEIHPAPSADPRLPMPSGWFRVATSEEVPANGVAVVRMNGRELVAFRGGGEVSVVDPICPHMGAHLGHGGRVIDGNLRCPFHGLRFDGQGRCVGSEYPGNPTLDRTLRTWPVTEQLGCIFVYFGHDDSTPDWTLPQYDTAGWTRPRTRVLQLKGHVQDIAENSVDLGHFAAVHAYSELDEPTIRMDGPYLHSKFGFTRKNPFFPWGQIQSVFDTDVHGLGLSVTDLRVPKLGMHYRVILTATQLDADRMSFGVGVSAECPPPFVPRSARRIPFPWRTATRAQMALIHRYVVADVLQDQEIWEHRIPIENPALIPGDGPIVKFRRWVKQFYA
ncbi:MAG: Rieske 2Fe-2S domain-containing protein [Myxococcota bacterium]